jgi:GMP synthase (glutamine-hydrolysing)
VVTHVDWEAPFRILDAFPDIPIVTCNLVDNPSTLLPSPAQIRGAVIMGGPMSVNDADRLAGIAIEIDWIATAIAAETPILGVCLGAQLIAKAAGAAVVSADKPEVGVSAVEILDPGDVLLGSLAPSIAALHWHGECFDLPAGAVRLARSSPTPVQAFRLAEATWGLQFHLEADRAVIDRWLTQPGMAAEARAMHGPDFAAVLRAQADQLDALRARRVFDAFASVCAKHRPAAFEGGR